MSSREDGERPSEADVRNEDRVQYSSSTWMIVAIGVIVVLVLVLGYLTS